METLVAREHGRSALSARLPGVLTLVLLSAFACNASEDATPTPSNLTGTSWQLLQFTGRDGKTLAATDPAKYTIAFNKGAFSMRVDCNRGSGSWESSGPNRLQFGPLLLTRAMCPPDPFNDRIPKDWTDLHSYAIKDNHLFLSLKDNGGTYEFQPIVVLENTRWKLTRLGDAPVPQSQPEPYLTLEADTHRFSGSGGCNWFNGSYELDGDHLNFGERVASTMKMCGKVTETETRFLGALAKTKTWSIAGQELKLSGGEGNVLATLEAASR
ncbi:MAG TPA: META domain-containing protein [Bryobacteraceae bacterium]|jgi:heat shock protein HslJ|nr:META domain-containing protein [Bryobacteraceae bacterium]